MEMKLCSTCKTEKLKTTKYFGKNILRKDGFQSKCKSCTKIDRASRIKKTKEYSELNKEKIKMYSLKWRNEHKGYGIEAVKKYRATNKAKKTARCYYEKIKGRLITDTERERGRKNNKRWRDNNRIKGRIKDQKREARKRNLPCTLTIAEWENIKSYFNNRCCYCDRELPLAQEHFLALSKGGEYTINNILPSCRSCNSSKSNRPFEIWYHYYKYYSKKRETKILKFLNYENGRQQLRIV